MSIPPWTKEAKDRAKAESRALVKVQIQGKHIKQGPLAGMMIAHSGDVSPEQAMTLSELSMEMCGLDIPRPISAEAAEAMRVLRSAMRDLATGKLTMAGIQEEMDYDIDGKTPIRYQLKLIAKPKLPSENSGESK